MATGVSSGNIVDAINLAIVKRQLLEKHILPAKVIGINYKTLLVDCQVMLASREDDDNFYPYADIYDVPLFVLSANMGKARITMPVRIGDPLILLCSDRDTGDLKDGTYDNIARSGVFKPANGDGIMAICGWYPIGRAREIDSNNIVVENGNTKLTIEPSGKVIVDTIECMINAPTTINGHVTINGMLNVNDEIISTSDITGKVIHGEIDVMVGDESIGDLFDGLCASHASLCAAYNGHTHNYNVSSISHTTSTTNTTTTCYTCGGGI